MEDQPINLNAPLSSPPTPVTLTPPTLTAAPPFVPNPALAAANAPQNPYPAPASPAGGFLANHTITPNFKSSSVQTNDLLGYKVILAIIAFLQIQTAYTYYAIIDLTKQTSATIFGFFPQAAAATTPTGGFTSLMIVSIITALLAITTITLIIFRKRIAKITIIATLALLVISTIISAIVMTPSSSVAGLLGGFSSSLALGVFPPILSVITSLVFSALLVLSFVKSDIVNENLD
jgi:hypothetical protein